MNDIFLAYGDSFTWGHGLQYYDWIKNSKMSKEEIKDFLLKDQQATHHQWVNFDFKCTAGDLESMRKRRYTTLLSKELGMDYISRINNGGSNFANVHMITRLLSDDSYGSDKAPPTVAASGGIWWDDESKWKKANHSLNRDKLMNRKIKFIVLQLTDIARGTFGFKSLNVHSGELEHVKTTIGEWWDTYLTHRNSAGIFRLPKKKSTMEEIRGESDLKQKLFMLRTAVRKLFELCKKNNIKLYVWAWPTQAAYLFNDEPYFVTINYEGKEYSSYEDLLYEHPKFCLGTYWNTREDRLEDGDLGEYGVSDEHPSEHFHKLISETLLNKINGDK